MRLRSLRRLEEMEIRREHAALTKERRGSQHAADGDAACAGRGSPRNSSRRAQKFGAGPLGARRTAIGTPPPEIAVSADAFVEREPITVILSEKGWARAVRGHLADGGELRFKEGDRLRLLVPCETTDRLCLFGTNGRAYTLRAGDLPRGRGDGQPIRLLAELTNEDDVVDAVHLARGHALSGRDPDGPRLRGAARRICWPTTAPASRCSTSNPARRRCSASRPTAITSRWSATNRKLLVFPLEQVPETGARRGRDPADAITTAACATRRCSGSRKA